MANKFTMKETTVSNEIEYVLILNGLKKAFKDRLEAYKEFDKLKRNEYNNIVLKKVTTNVETEYLERG